ncbi:hypothetical protein KAH37_08220 [bacterium]|nr:hypothetical protein [bacterium]
MGKISLKNISSLLLDGRHLAIDQPGKTRKDIQIITKISAVATRYPSSLRITTKDVADSMHIRTFMTVAPPATIASGPFSFEFFPHESGGGFNLLINKEFFYFSHPQSEFVPFENPIQLLILADRIPLMADRDNIKTIREFSILEKVIISGDKSEAWLPLFPAKISVEIERAYDQLNLFGDPAK